MIRTGSALRPPATGSRSLSAGGNTVAVKALSEGRQPQSLRLEHAVGDAGEFGAQQVTLFVEPLFSHSGRIHEKRDFGFAPKSLLILRWCRRGDSNPKGFPHLPSKGGYLHGVCGPCGDPSKIRWGGRSESIDISRNDLREGRSGPTRYPHAAWKELTVPPLQARPFGRSVEHLAQETARTLERVHGSAGRRLYSSKDPHRQK